MYQKSNISLLELTHEYFTGWAVCADAKRLKACRALLCFCHPFVQCCGNEKHISLSLFPVLVIFFALLNSPPSLSLHPFDASEALCLSIDTPAPPLTPSLLACPLHSPQTPLSLFVLPYLHLKSCSFPGGWNLVELRETTGSDLFIILCMFVAFASTTLTSSIFY